MEPKATRPKMSEHILPNSSMMIGVSMTVISIIKLIGIHSEQHQIAELLAINSMFFMTSAILSYLSMRYDGTHHVSVTMEKVADVVFMVGLMIMTAAGILLAYEIF